MRMNKTSRLLAVLLALLLALGSAPAALGEGLVISSEQYAELSDAAVQEYYNALMAATTLDEFNAVVKDMTDEQWNAFVNKLSDEQKAAISAQVEVMIQAQVEADTYPEVLSAVNFSRVAPFMPPVAGTSRMMLMAANEEETNSGLKMSKTVEAVEGTTDAYTITLEAWATGEKIITSTEKAIPTDIILVLDQSGSMNFCMYADCNSQSCSGTHRVSTYTETYSINTSNNNEYYYYNNGSYSRARYCSSCGGWYTEWHSGGEHDGTRLTPKTSADSEGTQFYTQSYGNKSFDKRKEALVDAVEAFVADVYEKAGGADKDIDTTTDNVDHKIAIVGFASESGNGNNTEILSVSGTNSDNVGVRYGSLNSTHYTNALQDVSTSAGQTMINNAVDAIDAEGATEVNLGLEIANNIFANNAIPSGETRNRVVVVFTDGTPTTQSSYSATVANAAISQSKTLKGTYGATVYSVGIFGGADGSNPGSLPADNNTGSNRENRFMHLVSSNYLTASSMTDTGSLNSNLTNGKSYYLSASDKSTLMSIFTSIAQDIESGSVGTTLNENAVVKDVLSDQFVLANGTDTSKIEVYTAAYTAANTFAAPVKFESANVAISADGKTISVTNFDYAANWVGTETVNGETTYRGQKLIIKIPIKVREGFLGGNGVYTNESASGIYEGNQVTEALDAFNRPTVDVEIKDVAVTAPDKNVYLLGDVTQAELEAALTVKVGDVELDMDAENYGLESWQYAYVTIGENDGTADYSDLTGDKSYAVSVTVTPKTEGTAEAKSGNAIGNIYVFKPVLTFNDSSVKYRVDTVANPNYYDANNKDEVVWTHKTSTATPTGTEPTLTYTYGAINADDFDTDGLVVSTDDIPVKVTAVKIGETVIYGTDADGDTVDYLYENEDVDGDESFAHVDCTVEGCTWENRTDGAHFLLHVTELYGSLMITKTVKDSTFTSESARRTFNFTAVRTTDNMTYKIEVVVTGETKTATVTLDKVLIGDYIVTEGATNEAYTTAYEPADKKVTVVAGQSSEVKVTNTATGTYTSVPVTKTWEDNNNALGLRPASITVTLTGKVGDTVYNHGKTALTLNADGNWSGNWTDVPKFDENGNLIEYTVAENEVDKYDVTYGGDVSNGFTINNAITIGRLTITKSGMSEGESAVFKVTVGTDVYEVVLTGPNASVTLTNLLDDAVYSVVEDGNWSWSYEQTTASGISGAIEAGEVKVASFENTKNEQWLYDESSAVNKFVGTNN